jgi:hypothetical protein
MQLLDNSSPIAAELPLHLFIFLLKELLLQLTIKLPQDRTGVNTDEYTNSAGHALQITESNKIHYTIYTQDRI